MPTDVEGIEARFQELAEVDPSRAFKRFDPEDLAHLEAFANLCERLNDRALFKQGARFHFSASSTNGVHQHLEHAGEDALRSMMMDFRRLWMSSEPTFFPRLRNRVRAHADPAVPQGAAALAAIDLLGRDFKEACEDGALGLFEQGETESPDNIRWIKARQVVDDWINGDAFHGDPEPQARVGIWEASSYEFVLIKAVNRITNVWLAFCVLLVAILDERDHGMPALRGERGVSVLHSGPP